MTAKNTDRKGKNKDQKSTTYEMVDALATFKLPDSLPCSEIDFPVFVKKKKKAKWSEIVEESNERMQKIQKYVESKNEDMPKSPFLKTECEYINSEVFIILLPALEETLRKAKIWEALVRQKCFFNGIDHIAQVLWNNNPRYPGRKFQSPHIFNMPWAREHLKNNPRPYYPKSWLWPEEYAATLIQKTVRQYFVQRQDDVQEMRDFWRKLKLEQSIPELDTNPFLSRRFASTSNFQKN
uniref:IQ domain-containing protein K n=1 Tax=Bombyx mori TaxID=7091 RepID=A0A8R2LZ44_BOMMO|nr:IQ domain-containing protein K-like isoform X1 [Bombyx mori]